MYKDMFYRENSVSHPKLLAHRGANSAAPENSLPAFEIAARMGSWAIETDVHMTKDGKLVCFHNAKIDGLTDGEGAIADLTFDELRKYHITAGNNVEKYSSDKLLIPTFLEYLTVCHRYGNVVFLELKTDIAEETLYYVRQMGLEDRCVYSSVKLDRLKTARKLSDRVFIHHIFSKDEHIDELCEMGYSGLSFKIADLDEVPEGTVERIHKAGLKICFRAADDVETVKRAIAMGTDYVPTNKIYEILPKLK